MVGKEQQDDRTLNRVLGLASRPPGLPPDLAARIIAEARVTPQEETGRGVPLVAAFAMAASLALGVWLGAQGVGDALWSSQAAAESASPFDLTGLTDAEVLSEGDTL